MTSAGAVSAQSPTPANYMEDATPGNGIAPGSTMMVVEGLGSLGCGAYSQNAITSWTGYWVNAGYYTVTEITPQSYCGSVNDYNALIQTVINDISNLPYAPGNWGGIMLDEEGQYGFSAAQLASINAYTQSAMGKTPGAEWWYSEDQPNSWDAGTYNYLLMASYAAPQVYNQNFANAVNNECYAYNNCYNLVTVWAGSQSPFNTFSYAVGAITGNPYNYNYINWYNVFQPA